MLSFNYDYWGDYFNYSSNITEEIYIVLTPIIIRLYYEYKTYIKESEIRVSRK